MKDSITLKALLVRTNWRGGTFDLAAYRKGQLIGGTFGPASSLGINGPYCFFRGQESANAILELPRQHGVPLGDDVLRGALKGKPSGLAGDVLAQCAKSDEEVSEFKGTYQWGYAYHEGFRVENKRQEFQNFIREIDVPLPREALKILDEWMSSPKAKEDLHALSLERSGFLDETSATAIPLKSWDDRPQYDRGSMENRPQTPHLTIDVEARYHDRHSLVLPEMNGQTLVGAGFADGTPSGTVKILASSWEWRNGRLALAKSIHVGDGKVIPNDASRIEKNTRACGMKEKLLKPLMELVDRATLTLIPERPKEVSNLVARTCKLSSSGGSHA